MIIRMVKVRILGPRPLLSATMRVIQALEVVQLCAAPSGQGLNPIGSSAAMRRRQRTLMRTIGDVDVVLGELPTPSQTASARPFATTSQLALWARLARRTRRRVDRLTEERHALEEEQALVQRYLAVFSAFESITAGSSGTEAARIYYLLLRSEQRDCEPRLRQALSDTIGAEFSLHTHALPNGDAAMLLIVSTSAAARVERSLAEAGIDELPLGGRLNSGMPAELLPATRARLVAIRHRRETIRAQLHDLGAERGANMIDARSSLHNEALNLTGLERVAETVHAFVVEGWLPEAAFPRFEQRLSEELGTQVVIEQVATGNSQGEEVPVVLSNPAIFRPFEAITRMVPLPCYGSIDPTPYVAVFFPMFFGVILGDVGYGIVLAVLSAVVHVRSGPGHVLKPVAKIGGACALFTIVLGLLYGEFFGDLGHRWWGLKPLGFNREESILPFLALAFAIGFVHIVVGLGIGVASAFRRDKKHAVGRGLSVVMLVLLAAVLLTAVDLLPAELMTPGVIAVVVVFAILIAVEGLIAPIEFLSTVANVLSYARIMALGTASVMMAVVANRLAGSLGSALVGVVFAVVFHVVNFVLGVFAPTVHALRLHYVEFWGKFASTAGIEYRPFGLWHPNGDSDMNVA